MVNEAVQNPSEQGLIISDGFAAIPAWGWDSSQDTILGIPARAYVNKTIDMIPDRSKIVPSLYLTFDNSWVLNLIIPFAAVHGNAPTPFVIGSAYIGESFVAFNPGASSPINDNLGDLAVLAATIHTVANLPAPKWDELIAKYIVSNPYRPGLADAVLAEYGVSVWALVGAIILAGSTADEVAEGYAVPREAVDAALAYYQQHRSVINARIAANNVGVA
jgi:uncharacterized protein (DUF433 family)